VLGRHVAGFVSDLLDRNGLTTSDVDSWAIHPGGPRILDVVADRLGLDDAVLAPSRRVLAEHGNCSSPTVLLIVDALTKARPRPNRVLALAFGPGLTLYGALLSVSSPDG
jgi:predicted naringenin-chalcone synthase